uniref:Protein kintoun n=1 Tax=Lygus hesperus TaxID=30085 RepID=A0A0A9ZGU2_LYGHE
MDRYKKEFMSGVDVSKRELKELKEAFKQDKFKELFKEYVDEVNDPENQALYEKELLQLEKERGVDSTFLRPTPGYVIKTSVENDCQAFINVCYNEKIERPSSVRIVKDGKEGDNWSVPHVFGKGRMEINKEKVEILVYDVLFHPMALDLAHRNPEFKNLVNDTAMTAVEDGDKVKLDRRNARIAKSSFVGGKFPCLLRKKSDKEKSPDVWEMPGYPYPPIEKDVAPVVKEIGDRKMNGRYTTPNYVIKERKGVDISECRLSKDAKMMAAIPEELVIEIPLPLLRSANDANLDVREKCLSLVSEKPAKYKLEITLPYVVDDDNGTAKFDKDRKILTVTLPVRRKKYDHDFHREDSGIDSDVTHNEASNRSSSEEELNYACNLDDDEAPPTELIERLSEEVKEVFLDPCPCLHHALLNGHHEIGQVLHGSSRQKH